MRKRETPERGLEDGPRITALLRDLLIVRRAEERLSTMFADGEVPGFIHLSIGQEAVSVGVMRALTPQDTIASTHRGHGHAIAKGMSLDGFFAELLAKSEGLCRGRGGSMHVADMSVGMLGANGIVGAGLAIALGSALAHKTLGRDAVAVAFFGDGALAEGLVHECMNLAALWKLPLLFVCENNGWGEFRPTSEQLSFALADLAGAYRIPHRLVDGNDVVVVADAADEIVRGIREGGGPAVLECMTVRVRGHFEGDAQKYRDQAELEASAARDPIRIACDRLAASGVNDVDLEGLTREVDAVIEAAVSAARRGTDPDPIAARRDVYTDGAAA
jgi:TPP-dependent pyruvate/acetoin dehydrogenase alpha subunit